MSQFARQLLTARSTFRSTTSVIAKQQFKKNIHSTPARMTVHNITSAAEWEEAKKSGVVVVDCFATWCGPCKMIAPTLVKFSDEYSTAKFVKIDVDELPDIAAANKVSAMPTFLFFKDGKAITQEEFPNIKDGRVVGADPRTLKAAIEAVVNSEKA